MNSDELNEMKARYEAWGLEMNAEPIDNSASPIDKYRQLAQQLGLTDEEIETVIADLQHDLDDTEEN